MLATDVGQAGIAGLVHAVLGVGSVIAGLAIAGCRAGSAIPPRMAVAAALGCSCCRCHCSSVNSLAALVVVVLVLGFVVAPYMISNFTMGERSAPASQVGAAMTLLAAATGLGYAVGSALAGRLADDHGHTAAFAVTVTAAAGALLLSLASQRLLRRPATGHAEPTEAPAPSAEVAGTTAGVVHADA